MIKILFLAANPRSTPALKLKAEADAIAAALERAKYAGHFQFVTEYAVRASRLQELLLKHRPHVVHFSGHGAESGEIILEDEAGYPHAVAPEALKHTFALFREDVRLVVINACHSRPQAEAIAQCVPGVIGLQERIADDAAMAFAAAFYQALAYGRDVQAAFDLGCNQLEHQYPGSQYSDGGVWGGGLGAIPESDHECTNHATGHSCIRVSFVDGPSGRPPIPPIPIDRLKQIARREGVVYQTLIRMWIVERMALEQS